MLAERLGQSLGVGFFQIGADLGLRLVAPELARGALCRRRLPERRDLIYPVEIFCGALVKIAGGRRHLGLNDLDQRGVGDQSGGVRAEVLDRLF